MSLGELIAELKTHDPARVVPLGFHRPHSYRGYYSDLAFEPAANVTVGSMLAVAELALDQTFQGYKGGDYVMREYTACWLAFEGRSDGDGIGPVLLAYMLGNARPELVAEMEAA